MLALDWLPDGAVGVWIVPVAGLAACGVAWLVGRQMLTPRPGPESDGIPMDRDFLQGVTRDRRGTPRRKGNTVEVRIKAGDADPVPGWILDRSMGGVCILTEHSVPPGTRLLIRARLATEQTPWTEAIVKSCRLEGAQHELGCEFTRTPNWNLLLQFG